MTRAPARTTSSSSRTTTYQALGLSYWSISTLVVVREVPAELVDEVSLPDAQEVVEGRPVAVHGRQVEGDAVHTVSPNR
jgi:hypothetical protein